MTETLNYSFYSEALLKQFDLRVKDHYQVKNPINPEQEYMRTSLIPRLYENLLNNYQTRDSVELFEVGHIYLKTLKGMPDEKTIVAGLFYNKGDLGIGVNNTLATLFNKFNIDSSAVQYVARDENGLIELKLGKEIIGKFGQLTKYSQKLRGIPFYFEIDLNVLGSHSVAQKQFHPFPDHPAVARDMTFKTTTNVNYHDIISAIKAVDELIVNVHGVKKMYQEPDNKKSISFRITYQALDRTLKSEEVEEIEKEIMKTVANKFKMELKK